MEAEHRSPPPPPHNIALLPPPGLLGHLIPFIELAKKLVLHHNCTVTLIIPHDGSPMETQTALLQGIPAAITPVFLPPTDDKPENLTVEISVPTRLIRSLPALRDTLSSLRTPAAALVVDLFAPDAVDVAREFEIPAYIFYIAGATELSLCFDLPRLDESWSTSGKRDDLIKLPGPIVINPEDFSDSMRDRNSEIYKSIIGHCSKYVNADGFLVNSFLGLESEAFHELERRRPHFPPVYPVGPMIRAESDDADDDQYCLKWLNDQPPKSVLFVSFGSVGSLSVEQFTELALGLEMSGQRFLWVVRRPQENVAAAYLSHNQSTKDKDPLECLPQGFLERTKDRGLVVASWAPQVRVLSHGSTGGFVTHCGWSSILEAVVYGVPMIAWPLCFDHKMNAIFLTDGLEGAVRVRKNGDGVVERGCISLVVKQLMESGGQGKKIGERMREVKVAAADALYHEGSSAQALAQVVNKWDPWKE